MCKCETVLILFAQFQCCDRRLLSAKLRSFRIHLLKQTKGAFLPLPCVQVHSEALASLFNLPFRNGGKVQCYAISQMLGNQLGLTCRWGLSAFRLAERIDWLS
jgi:hypothetical protein